MSTQNEIRERISQQIVDALEKGVRPWRKPWIAGQNTGFPTNVASSKQYRGINPLLLQLSVHKHGFSSKFWGTYNQWSSIGGQVQKRPNDVPAGSWGTKVIFYKPVAITKKKANGEETESTFPLLREYTVFNADQVDGADAYRCHSFAESTTINYQPAEDAIASTGADIRHVAGDQACYFRPPLDFIRMPLKQQFEAGVGGLPGYYDTIFHELAHWSESRLDWKGSYALGELRAELSAAFLTAAVGVPQVDAYLLRNNAPYLGHWIEAMKGDPKVIFQISSAASKASDFILGFSQAAEEEDEAAVAA